MMEPIVSPGNAEHAEIMRRLKERIAELKDELAQPLDLDATNRVRGAIGELQRIVSDAAPERAITPPDTPRYS